MKKINIILLIVSAVLITVEIIVFSILSFSLDKKYAYNYYMNGQYQEAVSIYSRLIKSDTNGDVQLYIYCADSYLAAGDHNNALQVLELAVDKNIDDENINKRIEEIVSKYKNVPSTELVTTNNYRSFSNEHITSLLIIITVTACIWPFFKLIVLIKPLIKRGSTVIKYRSQAKMYNDDNLGYANMSVAPPDNLSQKTDHPMSRGLGTTEFDPLIFEALKCVIKAGYAKTSFLQLCFKISYFRAVTLLDEMESLGFVGPYQGSKPRDVLIDEKQAEEWYEACLTSFSGQEIRTDNTENNPADNELGTPHSYTMDDVLLRIDGMSEDGWKFEKFTAWLLLKNGFHSAQATSGSNDYGVDVIAEDQLGNTYAIQCKCYSNKVDNKAVQEVYAGKNKYGCDIGVVFTNNYFTKNAQELAESSHTRLWDRDQLVKFIESIIGDINFDDIIKELNLIVQQQ